MKALSEGSKDRPTHRPDDGQDRSQDHSPVTIYQVAERAGVSIATVSRALRDTAGVSAATREKVERGAAELDFVPSYLGQALAGRGHGSVGLVFPDITGPYHTEVILGFEEAASKAGRTALIQSTRGADPDRVVLELSGRIDGAVLLGRTVADDTIARLLRTGLPVVLLARESFRGVDSVRTDNWTTARLLGEHIRGHGYETVGIVGTPVESSDFSERRAGIQAGLGKTRMIDIDAMYDVESGYLAIAALADTGTLPRALLCLNDELALGAITALTERGIRIPEDVALTGWDDILAAGYAAGGLTTVSQPMRELGRAAAGYLLERLQGEAGPARTTVLETELVIRHSCGCDRKGTDRA